MSVNAYTLMGADHHADAPLLESLWEDHHASAEEADCWRQPTVTALILAPWHGEASQMLHLACVIGFGETKKPRNSSPRPRPLLAHVTHARIVGQKMRSH